jgi:bacterioferritin (cytochrome b1)
MQLNINEITTIKNRVRAILEHEKTETSMFSDLIKYCEDVGAVNTATTLINILNMKNYINVIRSLENMEERIKQEETRLEPITPESSLYTHGRSKFAPYDKTRR